MPEEEEPDADAMWNDEAMLPEEWKTDGKSVEEQDADWHTRQQKRMAAMQMEEEETDGKSVEEQDVDYNEAKHGWGIWMVQNGIRKKTRTR